jgi:hypothetical protein
MKHLTAIAMSMLALSGCFYPEVDEGGFPRGVDAGVDAAIGVDVGVDTNVWIPLAPTVAWCSSGSYQLPCTCVDQVGFAFTTCAAAIAEATNNPARLALASCIDTARGDGAGCGRPYCEDVRICYDQNQSAMTADDKQAVATAYECIDAELRAANCVGAP